APSGNALSRLLAALGPDGPQRGPPPVERWNPPYCGEIDMRIAADGSWHYMGTPITRPALVRLFSTVLRKDPERYVLVTPVERVGIAVDDVPFVAVEMEVDGAGRDRRIALRTNLDDVVWAGSDHPLRFETDSEGGIRPYVHVRGGLWARATRALALDLVALGEAREGTDKATFGLWLSGTFLPIAPLPEPDTSR
ncbi:MAG: DUF1285 domain-containing protein, partial [Microvirga sp.]